MYLLPISLLAFDSHYPELPLWPASHLQFSSRCSSPCFVPVVTAEAVAYFSSDTTVIFDFPASGP